MRIALMAALLGMFTLTALADTPEATPEDSKKTEKVEKKVTAPIGAAVGNRLPHFKVKAWDLAGADSKFAMHDSHALERATVYVFMSRSCPYCVMYQERLEQMTRAYRAKGVDFVMIYPTRKTPLGAKIAYHKEKAQFSSPFVNDKDASVAKSLKIKKTPEVVLVDKDGVILFRGGIDDNPKHASKIRKAHLKNALEDHLNGRPVSVTTAPLFG